MLPARVWGAVVFVSLAAVGAFVLQLYAISVLLASLVSAYRAVQPIAALLIAYIVIACTKPPHAGLVGADLGDLGGLAVVAGLVIIVHEEMQLQPESSSPEDIKNTSERQPLLKHV